MKENAVKNQSDTCTKTAGLSIAYTNNAIAKTRLGTKNSSINSKDINTGAWKSIKKNYQICVNVCAEKYA